MSKKILRSNIPMPSPLIFTVVTALVLDRFSAPGWVWGIVLTLIFFMWIAFIIEFRTEREVDVLIGK